VYKTNISRNIEISQGEDIGNFQQPALGFDTELPAIIREWWPKPSSFGCIEKGIKTREIPPFQRGKSLQKSPGPTGGAACG
jgi:hypothetical protein